MTDALRHLAHPEPGAASRRPEVSLPGARTTASVLSIARGGGDDDGGEERGGREGYGSEERGGREGDGGEARRAGRADARRRPARSVAIIGAGPRAVGVLERLVANAAEFRTADDADAPQFRRVGDADEARFSSPDGAGATEFRTFGDADAAEFRRTDDADAPDDAGAAGGPAVTVHLIDPFPAGPGRIWRYDQSPLLKLNSMAADVTMFTDASSTIDGPVLPGPSLSEWAEQVRRGTIDIVIDDPALRSELKHLTGSSFPTRRLQSLYLDWFHRQTLAALPPDYTVHTHAARAQRVDDLPSGAQRVVLDTGVELDVDIVLYSLGHNGSTPEREHTRLIDFAARHELYYLPPAFTTDADTRALAPGQPVIVRGLGLAAVDLIVLLTLGRGGRFERADDGSLRYHASGREPRLLLGSRRGIPYHSKISSTLVGDPPVPTFFTPEVAAQLERAHAADHDLDFAAEVWPLIAKEMLHGYYRELFTGHPERTSLSWAEFGEAFAALDPSQLVAQDAALRSLVERSVIDPADCLLLPEFDRPLRGRTFATPEELQEAVRAYIAEDLRLRTAPEHSATLGLFIALLTSLFTLSAIADSPAWSALSRVRDLQGWWLGYFSYVASGPPGHRLEELVALSGAGVVEFLGGELSVVADEESGQFVATSPNVDRVVRASALVDARLPSSNVASSENEVLRSLVESGAGIEDVVRDAGSGYAGATGQLAVRRGDTRVRSLGGEHHERRYAVGPYTSSPFVGAFSRPNTNAISFRENDRVARAILAHLASLAPADPSPASALAAAPAREELG